MSNIEGGIPNGVHPSESIEKVTTIPNPEIDQSAASEQWQEQHMTNGTVCTNSSISYQAIHMN
jgi:hypothetical protein